MVDCGPVSERVIRPRWAATDIHAPRALGPPRPEREAAWMPLSQLTHDDDPRSTRATTRNVMVMWTSEGRGSARSEMDWSKRLLCYGVAGASAPRGRPGSCRASPAPSST